MTKSSVIKSCLVFVLAGILASPAFGAAAPAKPAIVAVPPGAAIDFYPVSATITKGARFVNTKTLPKLGYVASAPALQIKQLRKVKKIHTKTVKTTIESADGKKRTVSSTMPAIEVTLFNADATALGELMKKTIGQRVLIEAEGAPISAPLVREASRATTRSISLADDQQLEDVYAKLARFVKK